MPPAEDRERLLETADELFYGRGIQAVGMDDVRTRSGVPLKRMYRCYPSKEALVAGYLERRDARWRHELRAFVTSREVDARERILSIFDSLELWFREPDFRGCAFINAFGELGATSTAIADVARRHKAELLAFLSELATDAGASDPATLARQLLMVIDGCIVSAAFSQDAGAARLARVAAERLLETEPAGRT